MNILALEVSTSSAKTMIYSSEKGLITSNSIFYNQSINDITYQDPEDVYQTVLDCAREIIEQQKSKIDIIGLVSTWHSFLLLDENRKPVTKIMPWANIEAASTASKYRQDDNLSYKFYRKTGCPIHSIYPLWKWMHLLEKEKFSVTEKVQISSKAEYIFEHLTGEIGVSYSAASGTGFMNIHSLNWDNEILEFAGIKKAQLAPLRRYDYRGYLRKSEAGKLGLRDGIPVIITGPDGALNQIGSGALKNDIMTLSVGTSGALRMGNSEPLIPERPSTWCYYVGEGIRLAGAATSGAGNCVEWFKNNVNRNTLNYRQLRQMAREIDPEEAPVFLPFLYGERCPGWQDKRSGGFFALRGNHSNGHLYYSLLEGILFNLYQSYKILVELGQKPKKIRISGGINNSKFWLQMAADIFQRSITLSTVKDASTMGAIVIALKVMNEIDNLEDFSPEDGKTISPCFENALSYEKRFEKYMKWYKQT